MENRLNYIDALRGYAIIAVIIVHVSQMSILPNSLQKIASNGQMGVQLFLIISGFTIFKSMEYRSKNETHVNTNFYIRRFFRIAPIYYLSIIGFIVLSHFQKNNVIEIGNVLSHILFLNGFNLKWINTLVPGGWVVAIEMMFYVLVPFLFKIIKSLKHSIILFIISSVIAIGIRLFINQPTNYYFYMWLPNQLPIFSLGFIYFYIQKDFKKVFSEKIIKRVILVTFTLLMGLSFAGELFYTNYIIYGLLFLILVFSFSKYNGLLVNKYINYLGKISYDCYLTHYGILICVVSALKSIKNKFPSIQFLTSTNFVINFIVTLFISVIVSKLLHKYVEKPFITIGNNIIQKIES